MSTATTREPAPAGAPPDTSLTPTGRRLTRAAAGPAAIVASVLVATRGFAFSPMLTNGHPDILSFWLPQFCFLGRSLSAGHVPVWDPHQFAGTPFAADPQSGWLYAPAMLLFSTLSCGTALRYFIVLNPLLAGLGLHWFLRKEGLARIPSTVGGLSLAMMIGASQIGISLPFAGTIAWTPLVLVGASGYLSATRGSRRIAWLALAAFAWSQVASAHMSHGLVLCTLITAVYVVARSRRDVRGGDRTWQGAALLSAAFLTVLVLGSMAVLLPRLSLIARSSLRGGYAALGISLAQAANIHDRPLMESGVFAGWPFVLASAPGAYAGAAILLSIPGAVRTRRYRYLAVAFGAAAGLVYLLTLNVLISAGWFRELVLRLPFGDVYLHNPGRLRYLMFLVAPVLGALGIQGFLERPIAGRRRWLWVGGAAAGFIALPLWLGAHPVRFVPFAIGVAATAPVLFVLGRRRWAPLALAGVLVVELIASALYSQAYQGGNAYLGLEGETRSSLLAGPLRMPTVPVSRYLSPGSIARYLQAHEGRYLTWFAPTAYFEKGYLFTQSSMSWAALENERATLFGLQDVLGYNPIQLPRYWSYIRAGDPLPIFYNASVLQVPTMSNVRLLGVRYVIVPAGTLPSVPGRQVAHEGGFDLYEVAGAEPLASVVPDWTVASSAADALRTVLAPTFDPARHVVLEPGAGRPPGTPSIVAVRGQTGTGTAAVQQSIPESLRVSVDAPQASWTLIRNSYDPGWSATVDGTPAPVLRADYFLQAVRVPAGRHVVVLTYRDPRIGEGLLASGLVWLTLLVLFAVAIARERRRGSSRAGEHEGAAAAGADVHGRALHGERLHGEVGEPGVDGTPATVASQAEDASAGGPGVEGS